MQCDLVWATVYPCRAKGAIVRGELSRRRGERTAPDASVGVSAKPGHARGSNCGETDGVLTLVAQGAGSFFKMANPANTPIIDLLEVSHSFQQRT